VSNIRPKFKRNCFLTVGHTKYTLGRPCVIANLAELPLYKLQWTVWMTEVQTFLALDASNKDQGLQKTEVFRLASSWLGWRNVTTRNDRSRHCFSGSNPLLAGRCRTDNKNRRGSTGEQFIFIVINIKQSYNI